MAAEALGFWDWHRMSFVDNVSRPGGGIAEFVVGGYCGPSATSELDGRGEFRVELHQRYAGPSNDGFLLPRLLVFKGGFDALREAIVHHGLLTVLESRTFTSGDEFSRVLMSVGFRDVSDIPLEPAPEVLDS